MRNVFQMPLLMRCLHQTKTSWRQNSSTNIKMHFFLLTEGEPKTNHEREINDLVCFSIRPNPPSDQVYIMCLISLVVMRLT